MSDLAKLTGELMHDDEFKKEYEALQPEREIALSLIRARKEAGMTQAELSKIPGSVRQISAGLRTEQEIPAWRC